MKDGNSFRVNEITPATTAEIVTGTQFVSLLNISALASRFMPVSCRSRLVNTLKIAYIYVGGIDVLSGLLLLLIIWWIFLLILIRVTLPTVSFIELQQHSVVVIWGWQVCDVCRFTYSYECVKAINILHIRSYTKAVTCPFVELILTWDDGWRAILFLVVLRDPGVECPPVFIGGESLNCKTKTC